MSVQDLSSALSKTGRAQFPVDDSKACVLAARTEQAGTDASGTRAQAGSRETARRLTDVAGARVDPKEVFVPSRDDALYQLSESEKSGNEFQFVNGFSLYGVIRSGGDASSAEP